MPELFSRNRLIVWIVLGVVLLGLVIAWIFFRDMHTANHAQPVVTVPSNKVPPGFPSDIPLEPGAIVVSNFNSPTVSGETSATRSFQVERSVIVDFAFYDQLLTSNPKVWTIISQVNVATDKNNKSIIAKNSTGTLTIAMTSMPPKPAYAAASIVTITYVTDATSTQQ